MPVDDANSSASSPAPMRVARPMSHRSGWARRWRQRVREFLRPDHLREFGTTLALVVPLTVLIWVWAEREQTVSVPYKGQFNVSLGSSNPDKSVTLEPGRGDTITVELTGPRAGMEAMKEAILNDRNKARLFVDIGDTLEPGGPYPIALDLLLNQQNLFRDYGLTVLGTEPAAVPVIIDKQVERELPVQAPRDLGDVVQSVETTPATVVVRGPEHRIRELEEAGKLVAELDLGARVQQLRAAAPGEKIPYADVGLRSIEGVTFDTRTIVAASIQRSQDEQVELKSVAVFLSKPAYLESKLAVTVTPVTLTNVKLTGPRDVLQKLLRDEGDSKPYAVLTVTRDDEGKPGRRLPVIQNLPAGVRVVEGSILPVQFEVTEVTAVEALRLP